MFSRLKVFFFLGAKSCPICKSSIDDRHWLKHVLWEMQLKILLEKAASSL